MTRFASSFAGRTQPAVYSFPPEMQGVVRHHR